MGGDISLPEKEATKGREVFTQMPSQEWTWCQGPEHRRDGCIHTSSGVAVVLPPTGSQARSSGAQPGQVLLGSSLEGMLEAAEPRQGGWPGTTAGGPQGTLVAEVRQAIPPNPQQLGSGFAVSCTGGHI